MKRKYREEFASILQPKIPRADDLWQYLAELCRYDVPSVALASAMFYVDYEARRLS